LTGIVSMLNHVQVPFGGVAVNVTFRVRNAGGAMTVGVVRADGDGAPMAPVPVVADMQQEIQVPYYASGGEAAAVDLRADFDRFDGSQAIDAAQVTFRPQDPSFSALERPSVFTTPGWPAEVSLLGRLARYW
jgi:hypothetical protein